MTGSDDDPSESGEIESSLSDLAAELAGNDGDDSDPSSLADLADSIRDGNADAETGTSTDDEEWDIVEGSSDETGDPKTDALLDLVGDASNILVTGPVECPAEHGLCSRLLRSQSGQPTNLLFVLIEQTTGERLSMLQNYISESAANAAVVDVQTYDTGIDTAEYEGPVDIHQVSDPQNLRRMGILISKILSNWEESQGQTFLCFYSLSGLLKRTEDDESVFRFLHILRGRVRSADVRAHYHVERTERDDELIQTFKPLFDTVLSYDIDGSVSLD